MNHSSESRLIIAALLLGAAALSGCEGESRQFQEAVEIQSLGLNSIAVVPPASEITGELVINRGQSLQMSLLGASDTDDSVPLNPAERTWRSSNPDVVSISEDGVITGGDNGDAVVSVAIGEIIASLPVTVFDAALLEISSINGADSIELCQPSEYFAIGNFEGGSSRPVYDASYSFNDDASATVTLGDDLIARVNANSLTADAVTLIASAGGSEFEKQLTILNTLTEINVTPETGGLPVSIDVDELSNLVANGTYANIPGQPAQGDPDTTPVERLPIVITDNVEWSVVEGSENANVNNSVDKGRLRGVAEGAATVRASCGGVNGTLEVTVNKVEASTSNKLNFEVGGVVLDNGVVTIFEGDDEVLRVARGVNFADGDEISSNLRFSSLSGNDNDNPIDLNKLNDQSNNTYTISPKSGSAGTTTQIRAELTDSSGDVVATGTLFITIR